MCEKWVSGQFQSTLQICLEVEFLGTQNAIWCDMKFYAHLYFQLSQNYTVLHEKCCRKLHAEFHRTSLIRKRFKIGLPKNQKILFLDRFADISKSHKKLRFSTTHSYYWRECRNSSGKGFLEWKALEIDFKKCHFG